MLLTSKFRNIMASKNVKQKSRDVFLFLHVFKVKMANLQTLNRKNCQKYTFSGYQNLNMFKNIVYHFVRKLC